LLNGRRVPCSQGAGGHGGGAVRRGQGGGLQEDAMDGEGGRGAAAGGAGARAAELGGHRGRGGRARRQVVPAAVVPAPGAGAGQPPLHARGGRAHRRAAGRARQQVGHHRALPPRPVRQRRQEPLELGAPQDASAGLLPRRRRRRRGGRRRGHRRPGGGGRGVPRSVPTQGSGDGGGHCGRSVGCT